jgi:hypothetical protein
MKKLLACLVIIVLSSHLVVISKQEDDWRSDLFGRCYTMHGIPYYNNDDKSKLPFVECLNRNLNLPTPIFHNEYMGGAE